MPTANTSKPAEGIFFVFGVVLLLALHLFALSQVPGIHFDEAWALNFAYRLSEGEWTLSAMSPYTAPWAHYWAALWMKAFGPSLYVFRLSQVMLAFMGIGFMGLALQESGRKGAARLLPLTIALLPGLVMNHRFAIELTGFHVFCFGLLAWGLVRGWIVIAVLAWLAGTTGHILFYGVGIAAIGASIWERKELIWRDRLIGAGGCLLLALFFARVATLVPEKGKAWALVASAVLLAALVLARAERWKIWQKPHWESVAVLLALVFLVNTLFFLDGFWSLSITTGKEGWKGGRLINLLLFLPAAFWLAWRGSRDCPRWLRRAFLLGVICLGFMMLKPAPRYFELALLVVAVFVAQGLASLPFLGRMAMVVFLFLHATVLFAEYFSVSPRETALKFLFFKDSSRDFLSKQELVSVLGGSGCRLSDINGADSRVQEALLALSRADWNVDAAKTCKWKSPQVERRAESGRAGTREEVADFVIWEK